MAGRPVRARRRGDHEHADGSSPSRAAASCPPTDVDRQWLLDLIGHVPNGEVPLSRLEQANLWASVPAGKTSAEVTVPTVRDQVAEPTEYVGLQSTDDEGKPQGLVLTGTVLDAP